MPKHIGIVAVSPEGGALCYREISRRAEALTGRSLHPTISVHNLPFEDYLGAVHRDDWHTIGDMLARSAKSLASIGADFCLTPDNVMQHAVHLAQPNCPIPWLTMADLVADAIVADSRRVVGVIGTKMVMLGSTYQTTLGLRGIKVIPPAMTDCDLIDRIVFDELVHGFVTGPSQETMLGAIARMAERGAEGVILGCSEAPLVVTADNSPLPVYDAVALLADGAVRMSFGHQARKG
ncbi:MAG: aspartate/glutamate racemase family protein [Phycisphaerales bacterium]